MQIVERRPRGRPPMQCEKIQTTTRRKTEPYIGKAVVKKCESRSKKAYEPYRCTLTKNNKCVTSFPMMINNPVYSTTASTKKASSKASTKKASPMMVNNPTYLQSSSKASTTASTKKASTTMSSKSSIVSSPKKPSTGPNKVLAYTVKFYDNPAYSTSPKKNSVKMRNNPMFAR